MNLSREAQINGTSYELDKRTQPESELSDVVNNMTRKLVEKQNEIDKIKEECKVLKLEVKDLKKVI